MNIIGGHLVEQVNHFNYLDCNVAYGQYDIRKKMYRFQNKYGI